MSQLVIIELFKQFMSEGWSTNASRQMAREKTKLNRKYVWKVITESDECQELIKARIKQSHDNQRFLQQGENITWN
jgi:hypothetical protein